MRGVVAFVLCLGVVCEGGREKRLGHSMDDFFTALGRRYFQITQKLRDEPLPFDEQSKSLCIDSVLSRTDRCAGRKTRAIPIPTMEEESQEEEENKLPTIPNFSNFRFGKFQGW